MAREILCFSIAAPKDGLAVGQIMDVHSNRSIRDQKTPVSFSGASTGNVKIVKVDGSCATGVVLDFH